ncbi:hypothetical protein [Dyadobacter sp. Leaf189]|uniref:hypothetical protein n=1 Tax=Dyadobacter sp. Leaf189 TaxID=1736295 RepID=UPI000713C547|nr:hypothetical protein [Dyadobacter sp. Leaf189]KQS27007.1 hypothetical protein ASG33_20945 [Dyadobacter sp. Leaf189]
MMKFLTKSARLILLLFSGIILSAGLSETLQRKLYDRGFIPDQYRFGDLYNITNLSRFKELNWQLADDLLESDKPVNRSKSTDLFTIGDSFTTMDTSFYAGRRNYHIWLGTKVDTVTLDPSVRSIVVIELIERTIQERLRSDYARLYIDRGFQVRGKSKRTVKEHAGLAGSFWENNLNREINQRLEFILFNSSLALKAKEIKANLMLSWFGRTHPGSIISRNGGSLFYEIEASPHSPLSPYQQLSDADIDSVVIHMNRIRSHYLHAGFSEVYFCFIPNKVTVCEPDRLPHNHQITRISRNPRLKAPLLNIHDYLLPHPEWFHKSDGHWNVHGKRLWLKRVNGMLIDQNRSWQLSQK